MANTGTSRSTKKKNFHIPPKIRGKIRKKLLRWYDSEKRDLPWRGETDPYRIWVSEVMLQQTRVGTVLDRYPRFIARFGSISSLADAPLEAVLSEWQGLGYYSRARNLHRTARLVKESFGGQLPRERHFLATLPGFGSYMSGAVASIAFNERAAAVDGNVVRVLSRLIDYEESTDTSSGKRELEREAEALVLPSRPGDFNQAMMDLGSEVCLPNRPRCLECPLERECLSRKIGTIPSRPVKIAKKPAKSMTVFQLWAEHRNTLRLVLREENGLFGGMWELPGWMESGHHETPKSKPLQNLCRNFLGSGWRAGKEIARVSRTLTHRKILFIVFQAIPPGEIGGRIPSDGNAIWAKKEDLSALPISTAQRKAIDAAQNALANAQESLFGIQSSSRPPKNGQRPDNGRNSRGIGPSGPAGESGGASPH